MISLNLFRIVRMLLFPALLTLAAANKFVLFTFLMPFLLRNRIAASRF